MNKRVAEALGRLQLDMRDALHVSRRGFAVPSHPDIPREAIAGIKHIIEAELKGVRERLERIELTRVELSAALREEDESWKIRAIRAITEAE